MSDPCRRLSQRMTDIIEFAIAVRSMADDGLVTLPTVTRWLDGIARHLSDAEGCVEEIKDGAG